MSAIPFVHFRQVEDDLSALLTDLRRVLFRYPIASQALFAALVAEGRQFSRTPEGRRWQTRLSNSELFERASVLWNALGMTAFVESPVDALPSFFIDGVVRAATLPGLENLLSRICDDDSE